MDTSARHATAVALLAVGCGFSAASHAYSKEEDAAAQEREVQAAYDRGYKAAKAEMAQAAAAAASAAAAPNKAAGPAAQKPILDIKNTYSDGGEVATVMTVPVVVKPLADGRDAQAAAEARSEAAAVPQPVPHAYAQVPPNQRSAAAAPPVHDDVAPPDSLANDEAVDKSEQPRSAQVYSTQNPQYTQPVQPRTQYAQRQPAYAQQPAYPQQYAQQPVYAPPRPAYYPPPAPYQPPPRIRWVYWSPQYGRWIYY